MYKIYCEVAALHAAKNSLLTRDISWSCLCILIGPCMYTFLLWSPATLLREVVCASSSFVKMAHILVFKDIVARIFLHGVSRE